MILQLTRMCALEQSKALFARCFFFIGAARKREDGQTETQVPRLPANMLNSTEQTQYSAWDIATSRGYFCKKALGCVQLAKSCTVLFWCMLMSPAMVGTNFALDGSRAVWGQD